MRGDSYAWVAAQELHAENMRRKREQRAQEIIDADWDWARHVNDVLTVLEGGEQDA